MSQELFDIPGLQLPDNIYNLDSDTIIRKTRAKINDGIVNNEGLQMSEKDTGVSAHDIMGKQLLTVSVLTVMLLCHFLEK